MVFISYSHKDRNFVEQLAAELVSRRVHIWWDRLELKVGDSLIAKIQDAIGRSDFLAIVLSPDSVQSEWCRKELSAGLMRELDTRKVVVLPLLIADCEIPVFLRDKKYADFRNSMAKGVEAVIEALAAATDENLGRFDEGDFEVQYALDWGIASDAFYLHIDLVNFSKDRLYSVLAQMHIVGNEAATRRYRLYDGAGLAGAFKLIVLETCRATLDTDQAMVTIPDEKVITVRSYLRSPNGVDFAVTVRCRRLGEATGTDIVYHFGDFFGHAVRYAIERQPPLSSEEKARLAKLIRTPVQ